MLIAELECIADRNASEAAHGVLVGVPRAVLPAAAKDEYYWGDLIGLDVELAVMQVLYEGTKDPKYRPAPLLVEMIEAGYLGRKSGKGFYDYK